MRAEEFQGLGLEFTANLGLRVSQRVHIYYHYGTRSQKTITTFRALYHEAGLVSGIWACKLGRKPQQKAA